MHTVVLSNILHCYFIVRRAIVSSECELIWISRATPPARNFAAKGRLATRCHFLLINWWEKCHV
jgi:hypothetical protein